MKLMLKPIDIAYEGKSERVYIFFYYGVFSACLKVCDYIKITKKL